MILSDRDIKFNLDIGLLKIKPRPEEEAIQPASVDLHLSDEIIIYDHKQIVRPWDGIDKFEYEKIIKTRILKPRECILGSTIESVEISNGLVARVEGLSSLGRCFLLVHVTAGFIDPGFKGNVTLEIKNIGNWPIEIKPKMRICQLCFMKVTGPSNRVYGQKGLGSRYQNSIGTIEARRRK
jgi:dCTP deaminase